MCTIKKYQPMQIKMVSDKISCILESNQNIRYITSLYIKKKKKRYETDCWEHNEQIVTDTVDFSQSLRTRLSCSLFAPERKRGEGLYCKFRVIRNGRIVRKSTSVLGFYDRKANWIYQHNREPPCTNAICFGCKASAAMHSLFATR